MEKVVSLPSQEGSGLKHILSVIQCAGLFVFPRKREVD